MNALPTGTVTFLFTDIEGSTNLAQEYPEALSALLAQHHALLHQAIERHNGYVFQIVGDAVCAAFHTAPDALNAALEAQRRLQHEAWHPAPVRVRMGLHTGTVQVDATDDRAGGYLGYLTLTRAQRVMSTAYGDQVLLSNPTAELVRGELPVGVTLKNMGEHRLKGLINPEQLWQIVAPDLYQDFPPLSSLNAIPNNLPLQLTSFIGREKELIRLQQVLSEHRLVTLTGSGGTGKTRLSLQVAAELLDRFPDGVWFIELAPVTDPALISQTILAAIGLNEQQGRAPLELLQAYLRDRETLLVLDNCEHLIEESARAVNQLLHVAPGLKILASSREALAVEGELSFPVPSLSQPDPKHLPAVEQLSQYEAVRLFIDRAGLVAPQFVLDRENAPAIAQICYRLDGIPLAIELAAARVKMLSVEQISKRLDDRFRLLTGGARTALPRQQTLRALIDWSYDLLAEKECMLLQRLTLFAGGWTLEAAEFVCAGRGIHDAEVLDLLAHLVNKSLVVVEPSPESEIRYRMLETIRQYAREKLLESGDSQGLRDRHLDYYLQVVKQGEPEFFTAKELIWLVWIQKEWENLRAAVEWSLEKRAAEGLELVNRLGYFLLDHFYASDLENWLDQLMAHPLNAGRTERRAHGLLIWAWCIGSALQNRAPAPQMLTEAEAIYQELGNRNGLAHCFVEQALLLVDPQAMAQLFERALAIFRETNDKPWIASTLYWYGWSLVWREYACKRALLGEGLALYRELGYVSGIIETSKQLGAVEIRWRHFEAARAILEEGFSIFQAHCSALGNSKTMSYDLGDLAFYQGNFELAEKHYADALAWAVQRGLTFPVSWAQVRLGYARLRRGQVQAAFPLLCQVLRSFSTNDYVFSIGFIQEGFIFTLEGLAALAIAQGEYDRAASLFGWAEAIRQTQDIPRPPVEQASVERDLAILHSHLEDDAFEQAYQTGQALTLEQVMASALEIQVSS